MDSEPYGMRNASSPPNSTWLTVVAYRDFHDVPRLVLAMDEAARSWIMDCRFRDDVEEYSDSYDVFYLGQGAGHAAALDEHVARPAGEHVGKVQVSNVEFDATRHHCVRLKDYQHGA